MKKLLAVLTMMCATFAHANEKTQPSPNKTDPVIEKFCNDLGETYLTAYQKAMDGVNYTDLLFSVSISYQGDTAGLYLIMHTIEDAYYDKANDTERFKGAGEYKKRCRADELVNQIIDDLKQHPNEHVEEKLIF